MSYSNDYSFQQYQDDLKFTRSGNHVTTVYTLLGLIGELGETVECITMIDGNEMNETYDYERTEAENTVIKKLYEFVRLAKEIEALKKEVRKSQISVFDDVEVDTDDLPNIRKELGGVLWYLTTLAETVHIRLESVAKENKNQLQQRFTNNANWMIDGNKTH